MTGLSRSTRARVLWRSLFIQAGFNPEGLQTLGLFYTLAPALWELYPDQEGRRAAMQRHLTTFNTHPYISAAIVGGILFHEERIARGEAPPESVARFKSALMGPLAALGDGFFWLSLRPAAGAVSAALVPFIGAWAALVFLVLYNGVALTMRATFFRMGFARGDALVTEMARVRLPERGQRLRSLAAAVAGGVGAFVAARFGSHAGGTYDVRVALGILGLGFAASGLVRRVPPVALLYGGAALALALGALT